MSEVKMVHHHRDVQGGTARATVFGVSDGLVSNVGLILGVAAASPDASTVIAWMMPEGISWAAARP